MRMDRETIDAAIEEYGKRIGKVIGVSKKFVIDQQINDIFGAVIENLDPMHNDPGWANASPFGSTIVYGYLQLSLAAMIWKDMGIPICTSDKAYSLNYGLNRVRFPTPLRVGVPVQGTVRCLAWNENPSIKSFGGSSSQSHRRVAKGPRWWPRPCSRRSFTTRSV